MKKYILIILCIIMMILSGCGGQGTASRSGGQSGGVSGLLDSAVSGAGRGTPEAESTYKPKTEDSAYAGEIDIDLTALSSTMVYSEVYDMMYTPENYVGKTIKMGGTFAYYHNEATDGYYFACIIRDATACCSQGIEFILAGDHVYPDDYPAPGTEITVVGVFDIYTEDDYTYCTLRDAEFI